MHFLQAEGVAKTNRNNYEILPESIFTKIAAIVVSRIIYKHDPEVEAEFDEAVTVARQLNDSLTKQNGIGEDRKSVV